MRAAFEAWFTPIYGERALLSRMAVAQWDAWQAARNEALEEAAQVCEEEREVFIDGVSVVRDRHADAQECAAAIRAKKGGVTLDRKHRTTELD